MFKVGDVVMVVGCEDSIHSNKIGIVCEVDGSEIPFYVDLKTQDREYPVWFTVKEIKKASIRKSILFKLGNLYA